jgi:hypothetical protein
MKRNTRRVMADRSKKVVISSDGRRWDSVSDCTFDLRCSGTTLYRCMHDKKEYKGIRLFYDKTSVNERENKNNNIN